MAKQPVTGGQTVTSGQNPRVKLAASLLRRKERERHGLVLVEGERFVRQAFEFGATFSFFLVDPTRLSADFWDWLQTCGVDLLVVDDKLIRKASGTENPQGIVGVAEAVKEDGIISDHAEFLVVVDGLQDPGNLGAVQRVATALDVDALLVTEGTVDPKHPRSVRASAGAYFKSRLSTGWDPGDLADHVRELGFRLVVADAAADGDLFSFNWGGRIALVVGSEASGPDPRLQGTHRVKIPMPGGGESLNVAVAAGVLLYQAWHARQ